MKKLLSETLNDKIWEIRDIITWQLIMYISDNDGLPIVLPEDVTIGPAAYTYECFKISINKDASEIETKIIIHGKDFIDEDISEITLDMCDVEDMVILLYAVEQLKI